ncbi:MAG: alanine racemase [Microthrixaceae bacterium]
MTGSHRPSRVEVDTAAITRNVRRLAGVVSPSALCAVVKADGYGHGLVAAAVAARAGGADWLAVALVEEVEELRAQGVSGRVLVLSEPTDRAWDDVVRLGADTVVYTHGAISAAQRAAVGAGVPARLHLKVDTGMHRVGCEPADALDLAAAIVEGPGSELAGLATHFACSDDPASQMTDLQLDRFLEVDRNLAAASIGGYVRHVANSAAAISRPDTRLDMVRCGIALYGVSPGADLIEGLGLDPALRVVSEVSFVKRVRAGEPVSYGGRYVTARDTTVVTVPLGYADGVSRSFGTGGGAVLIGGVRSPVVGNVTMDQLMVETGERVPEVGAEVVLIGCQGEECIGAEEVAAHQGTIGYEVLTRLGKRLPRVVAT